MGPNGRATAALVLTYAVRASCRLALPRGAAVPVRGAASRALKTPWIGVPESDENLSKKSHPHDGPPAQIKKTLPRGAGPDIMKAKKVWRPANRGGRPGAMRSTTTTTTTTTTARPVLDFAADEPTGISGMALESTVLTARMGVFDVMEWSIPTFGDAAMGTYDNCADLEADLYESVRYLANEAILRNAEIDPNDRWYYPEVDFWFDAPMEFDAMPMLSAPMAAESTVAADSASAPASTTSDLSSFDTNNQEVGVAEKDVVVSDGDIVCARYGAEVVCWDAATGVELSRTKIPDANGEYSWMRSRVEGMFLRGRKADGTRRLIVVGSGYDEGPPPSIGNNTPIMDNYGNVLVMIWDMTDATAPVQLAERYIHGYLTGARIVGDSAHIVTSSYVNDWAHLTSHYDRYKEEFDGMNRTEYIDAALDISEEIIPAFVEQLMEELESDGECGDVSKIFFFQTGGDSLFGTGGAMFDVAMSMPMCWGCGWAPRPDSHIKNLMRITTFDVTTNSIATHTAKAFQPTSGYFIYASQNKLVIPATGYALQDDNTTLRSTMLRVFELRDGAAAEAIGIAVVPGNINNQFSMDEHDNHLRVASTIPREWGCRNKTALAENPNLRTWEPNCDYGISRESTNQLAIFKLPDDTSDPIPPIEQVSVVGDLGITEEIYSARFFDDKAYIVTFRRTDPFYAIDLTGNTINPPLGELKITGFSNYLHGFTQEGDVIVAIGMEADENGWTTGFAVSLFDASNLTDPQLIDRHFEPSGSGSNAQYDHLAFRAVPNPDQYADPRNTWSVYVIPVRIYDWSNPTNNWDGFKLYNVTYEDGDGSIEYMFNVSHDSIDIGEGCRTRYPNVPSRSLVIDGKLTTLKEDTVINTDLATQEGLWELILPVCGAVIESSLTYGEPAMGSYIDCDDLESDLYESARFIANEVIIKNAEINPWMPFGFYMLSEAKEWGYNDFGYDNQAVEMGDKDIVVNDGKIGCAAYGPNVVCWDAVTGEEVSRMEIPEAEANGTSWWKQPRVDGIFLRNMDDGTRRLIVLGTGYDEGPPASIRNNTSIMDNYGNVLVMIWDMTNVTAPVQLAERHINGSPTDARIVGDSAHIVTSSRVDTNGKLKSRFSRYNQEYKYISRTDYIDRALEDSDEIISAFVEQLMEELKSDGKCEDVAKIFLFRSEETNSLGVGYDRTEVYVKSHTHMDELMRVTTFDVTTNSITTHTAKAFQSPSEHLAHFSNDKVVVSAEGDALQDDNTTLESTALRVFELRDNEAAMTIGIAMVDGKLHNEFSMDEYDNHLRIASTIPREWGCRNETALADDPNLPTGDPYCDYGEIRPFKNQVAIFELPQTTVPILEDLGIDQEIKSAWFFDDKAYFVQDTFYSIGLTGNTINPPLGELNITGLTNYLHPLTEEADIIVVIGMQDYESGYLTGLSISLFDTTNLADPQLIAQHLESNETGRNARYNHEDFWAVPNPDPNADPRNTWSLYAIPLSINDLSDPTNNWDGFELYNITYDGTGTNVAGSIEYMFNVTHPIGEGCHWIPPRSFVIDSKLTTIKSHMVLNTDLGTENLLWELNLTDADC